MLIKCEWNDDLQSAKTYFEQHNWKLTSVEVIRPKMYRVKGAKAGGNIALYVIDGILHEWDKFQYKKMMTTRESRHQTKNTQVNYTT